MNNNANPTNTIAANAKATLGRSARRSGGIDWAAVTAVKGAAQAAGLTGELRNWVPAGAQSLKSLARAYVARYAQAYGPVGDVIDVAAHVGH